MTTQKSSIKRSGNVKSLAIVNEENNVNKLGNEIVKTNAEGKPTKTVPQTSKQAVKLLNKAATEKASNPLAESTPTTEELAKVKESKTAKEKTAPKAKDPNAPAKPKKTNAYVDFFGQLILAKKHTQKEMVEMAIKEFPEANPSTLATLLVDSKNPKYNRFEKLVIKDDKGILSFVK